MILIDGLEKAVVGYAAISEHIAAVYSMDRVAIQFEDEDDLSTDETLDVIKAIEAQCDEMVKEDPSIGTPPIFVRTADYDDLLRLRNEEKRKRKGRQ